jgi:hypothetical protein
MVDRMDAMIWFGVAIGVLALLAALAQALGADSRDGEEDTHRGSLSHRAI